VLNKWFDQGIHDLQLQGPVELGAFLALCNNQHPLSKERLTQRQKSVRLCPPWFNSGSWEAPTCELQTRIRTNKPPP
jgi:hypothetical protein